MKLPAESCYGRHDKLQEQSQWQPASSYVHYNSRLLAVLVVLRTRIQSSLAPSQARTDNHVESRIGHRDRLQVTQAITMISQIFVAVTMALATMAAMAPDSHHHGNRKPLQTIQSNTTNVITSTAFGTATLTLPVTISITLSSSTTETPSEPTYTATQLYAYRENSPIHLLPIQARGLYFQLGGLPTTACPSFIEDCPPGVLTGINQCQLVSS